MARPRQISTEKILEEASQCFLEQGLGISTQVIADRLGISQPALFKRFGTKKELILAALAPPERLKVIDWIEQRPIPGELEPQLEELLRKLWETLKFIFPRLMLLVHSNFDMEEFHKRYKRLPLVHLLFAVAGWFERASALGLVTSDESPEFLAQSCLGTLQGRAILRLLMKLEFGTEDEEEYIKSVVDVFTRGMKPEAH